MQAYMFCMIYLGARRDRAGDGTEGSKFALLGPFVRKTGAPAKAEQFVGRQGRGLLVSSLRTRQALVVRVRGAAQLCGAAKHAVDDIGRRLRRKAPRTPQHVPRRGGTARRREFMAATSSDLAALRLLFLLS